jgi:AGCS family alanine or glycine:cation symporter
MFQANQSYAAVAYLAEAQLGTALPWYVSGLYGVVLAAFVAVVIIGGIKRIGAAAGVIVPAMCGLYLLGGSYVLVVNAGAIPDAITQIFSSAFSFEAGLGGFVGVLIQGFRRAAFSNEAGVGSASIAHSAASTSEPVREGIVALLEPFIDTIVVCSMTGLVLVVAGVEAKGGGVVDTMEAFGTVLPWFPWVIAIAAILFAFSTMVSWSYYGESAAVWLFGEGVRLPYKVVFVMAVVLGSVLKLGSVLDFSDLMILGMAFPNILGVVLLSGKVKRALDEYMGKLSRGEFSRG